MRPANQFEYRYRGRSQPGVFQSDSQNPFGFLGFYIINAIYPVVVNESLPPEPSVEKEYQRAHFWCGRTNIGKL